ncbi:MAG: hypothetical protein AAF797_13960 [Planctomycetota bacterium]
MQDWLPILISGLALLTSVATAWFTLFRRGSLRMTQPTMVFIGPDGTPQIDRTRHTKVFLRTLLFSTSHTRQTVESIYVTLQRGETKQNFSIWVYGDEKVARGSGLSVGQEGVACNHHFLLPNDGSAFPILPGKYVLTVFAKRICDFSPRKLHETTLIITEKNVQELEQKNAGIYFDWGPDQQAYQSHVEVRPTESPPGWLLNAMGFEK